MVTRGHGDNGSSRTRGTCLISGSLGDIGLGLLLLDETNRTRTRNWHCGHRFGHIGGGPYPAVLPLGGVMCGETGLGAVGRSEALEQEKKEK